MAAIDSVLAGARDAVTAARVFGEPVERDGVVVIPVASVRGGGGGGSGTDAATEGIGGGFGMTARPVGAYVIRDGTVTWLPALDVVRLATGGMMLAGLALLTLRRALKRRR